MSATIALEIGSENQYTVYGSDLFGAPARLRDIPFYFGRQGVCVNMVL